MYWSPIRTRLLVGMLTPAIRAKAVTPVADSCVDRLIPHSDPLRHLPPPRLRRGRVDRAAHIPPDDPQRRISTNATPPSDQGLASSEQFFDWAQSMYGLHSDPSTSRTAFLRPRASFSTCGPVGLGTGSPTSFDDRLYSGLDALLVTLGDRPDRRRRLGFRLTPRLATSRSDLADGAAQGGAGASARPACTSTLRRLTGGSGARRQRPTSRRHCGRLVGDLIQHSRNGSADLLDRSHAIYRFEQALAGVVSG